MAVVADPELSAIPPLWQVLAPSGPLHVFSVGALVFS
jgi:hypothetical protein